MKRTPANIVSSRRTRSPPCPMQHSYHVDSAVLTSACQLRQWCQKQSVSVKWPGRYAVWHQWWDSVRYVLTSSDTLRSMTLKARLDMGLKFFFARQAMPFRDTLSVVNATVIKHFKQMEGQAPSNYNHRKVALMNKVPDRYSTSKSNEPSSSYSNRWKYVRPDNDHSNRNNVWQK